MNGGNISSGQSADSGSGIVATKRHWQKTIQRQKDANNLLSDRLREARARFRKREAELLAHIRKLSEDNKKLLTDALVAQVDELPEVETEDA